MAPTILAYQAMTPDAIGEDELPEAVALNSVAINLARAVGPALAGLLIVALSAGALFAIESAAVLLIMVVVFRLKVPFERPESPEPLFEALRAGARYVRFFGPARTMLIRAAPVRRLRERALGAPAGGGRGAARPRLARARSADGLRRHRRALRRRRDAAPAGAARRSTCMIALASLALAGGLAVLAWIDEPVVVGGALLFTGASWLTVLSSLNTAAQWAARRLGARADAGRASSS